MTESKRKKTIQLQWQGGLLNSEQESAVSIKSTKNNTKSSQTKSISEITGKADIKKESKGRNGKAVAIIFNFSDSEAKNTASLKRLCQELKKSLACGGTCEDSQIILTIRDLNKVADLLKNKNIHARII